MVLTELGLLCDQALLLWSNNSFAVTCCDALLSIIACLSRRSKVKNKAKSNVVIIANELLRNAALGLLMERDEFLANFLWYVTNCSSDCPLKRYHQLVCHQNVGHTLSLYTELTFSNVLLNWQTMFDRLQKEYARVRAHHVAKVFDSSGTYTTSTLVRTAYIA